MTVELLEALAADFLEDKHLVRLHLIVQYGSLDHRSINIRSSDLYRSVVSHEEDLLELHISTLGIGKPLHKDFVASLNLELLACNVYDCVHLKLHFKSFDRKRLPSRQLLSGLTAIIIYRTANLLIFLLQTNFYKFAETILLMNEPFVYHKPVTGADYTGRSAETRGLSNMLASGENIVIYEPPKSGKHSLIGQALFLLSSSGTGYGTAWVCLPGIRHSRDFASAFGSAVINSCCSSASECDEAVRLLLDGTRLVFDPAQYSGRLTASVSPAWDLDDEDFKTLFRLPYRLAEMKGRRVVVILDEFHCMSQLDDAERLIRLMESVLKTEKESGQSMASYVFCGSRINAMHEIFGVRKRFFRLVERVRLSEVQESDIVAHVNKGFNASGKVMDRTLVMGACRLFRNNLYYINQLCAICDSLTRGYVVENTMHDALERMLAIYGPRYASVMEDLTTFQMSLLKAVLEGHSKFTGADVIEDYSLNSSANVKRLKDALCKKEVISFDENGTPYVIDPLFEYWAREHFFKLNG